jgi:predicted secreted protein
MADIGYDTRFAIENAPGSGVFVELAEVFDVTPPDASVDQIDATHFQSPGRTRQFIPGLTDAGTVSVSMNFTASNASDQRIEALRLAGTVLAMRVTYPNGVRVTFSASVQSYTKAIPVDDRMTATAEMKVAGAVTIAASVAPANLTLPAISGLATVGTLMTAFEGTWTQGATYTYQWLKAGVAIGGAINKTYTPVSGDIGSGISVTVTATNAAGSAAATSVRTANVV